jgi:hypothetical protein
VIELGCNGSLPTLLGTHHLRHPLQRGLNDLFVDLFSKTCDRRLGELLDEIEAKYYSWSS